jgi:hypothetical protein
MIKSVRARSTAPRRAERTRVKASQTGVCGKVKRGT